MSHYFTIKMMMKRSEIKEICVKQKYLYCISKSSCQKKKSRSMLKSLLPKQSKRIFKSCLSPPIFWEVVGEEVCHALIPFWTEQSPHETLLLHGKVKNGSIQRILLHLIWCFCNLKRNTFICTLTIQYRVTASMEKQISQDHNLKW